MLYSLVMLRRGGGGPGHGGDRGASDEGESGHKVEAGVAEINNSLCSAMFGLVLSDEALRCHASLSREIQRNYCQVTKLYFPTSHLTLLFFGCGFSS